FMLLSSCYNFSRIVSKVHVCFFIDRHTKSRVRLLSLQCVFFYGSNTEPHTLSSIEHFDILKITKNQLELVFLSLIFKIITSNCDQSIGCIPCFEALLRLCLPRLSLLYQAE